MDTVTMDDIVHDLSDFNVSSGHSDDDSDWLDIASNRESSDDNDSVSSRDSDAHDGPLLPLSRRSSMSIGSSRGEDTDAWDGFTDDSSDEGAVQDVTDLGVDGPILSPVFDLDINEHEVEEHRLRAALDQSMISTLGSSRSGSHPSTVHNSLRDLRLSFPDPLTNSRDELSSSYDNVSSSVQSISPPELVEDPAGDTPGSDSDADADADVVDPEPEPAKEQGVIPVPVSPSQAKAFVADYTVKLYGSSSAIKWAFVRELLRSSCQKHGFKLVAINVSLGDAYQWLHFTHWSELSSLVIRVADHTLDASLADDAPLVPTSLAIVYLPCLTLPNPRSNAYYLPVEVPECTNVSDFWAKRARNYHTLALRKEPVIRYEDLPHVDTSLVHSKMSTVIPDNIKKVGSLFIALLVSVYGAALYLMVTSPASTTTFSPIPMSRTFTNASSSLSIRPSTSVAIVSQAYSLSLRPELSTALAVTVSTPPPAETTPCDCQGISWTERMKLSKDVIIAPATASMLSHAPAQLSKTTSSLSVRAVDSLSYIVDALLDSVSRDLKDLVDALDDLARAISRQTGALSKGVMAVASSIQSSTSIIPTSSTVRALIQYRHERAKGRALELRRMGGRLVSFAGEALSGRTRVARERARSLKEETLRDYRRAQGEWAVALGKKTLGRNEREREGRRA